jgi:hypothetical protein
MSSVFLKRDLQAAAKDAVPIGASTTNKKSKQDFKMPKPPPGAPPPMMIRMTQEEADTASATLNEKHVDAMVIAADGVDMSILMEKGLKYDENMELSKQVQAVQGVYWLIGKHRGRPVFKQQHDASEFDKPALFLFYSTDEKNWGWFVAEKLFDVAKAIEKTVNIVDRTNYNQFNFVKHVNDIQHNSDWQPQ